MTDDNTLEKEEEAKALKNHFDMAKYASDDTQQNKNQQQLNTSINTTPAKASQQTSPKRPETSKVENDASKLATVSGSMSSQVNKSPGSIQLEALEAKKQELTPSKKLKIKKRLTKVKNFFRSFTKKKKEMVNTS
ncbi:hypothetical protein RFI_31706 [Reticulomyxa filosa]|uniref:Uncharacterized protein n=1 Tax=Reticulomyxa filosa TaxID=46433 RepID=X6LY82_RETFI|nr:hypothetical protein RFI_31706 [Reticulomyxa filosa]|eukprot:ETO05690.1 hypothetical protein RFI_31706 [Reticulomyxa filosa]